MNKATAGSWVEIFQTVLEADKRAPQVPDDTKKVPLELKVKGFLVEAAELGEEVEIKTFAGRKLKGKLNKIEPAYEHKFGRPILEILKVGPQIREILAENEVE